MHAFKKALVVTLSVITLLAAGYGIHAAIHSPLFIVQVVEVADQPDQAPLDATAITRLADVPVGQINLFDLDLKRLERKMLENPWIREAHLSKRFPQTLSIAVIFREPRALFQSEDGTIAYVDVDGKIFGQLTLSFHADLPLLIGVPDPRLALDLLAQWEKTISAAEAQVASVQWDREHGYRAMVVLGEGRGGRSMVNLGTELDSHVQTNSASEDAEPLENRLKRLSQVFQYLTGRSVQARQIFADSGKKIVVKTAHGS